MSVTPKGSQAQRQGRGDFGTPSHPLLSTRSHLTRLYSNTGWGFAVRGLDAQLGAEGKLPPSGFGPWELCRRIVL